MVTETLHHLARAVRELQESSSKPRINPSVLVIVIILSVVFLCSGILHILARCLGRLRARHPPGGLSSPSMSIRGQLQHLFSLHDSGVDQVFIDTLPVFLYGSIRGLKDSADCAVCLTEFANEDKLRLLPKCKHAFHMGCIDTWLLSNSTCPLCRRSLLPEAEPVALPTSCAATISVAPNEEQAAESLQPQPSQGSFRGSFRASLRGSFRFLADVIAPPPPPPSERETAPVLHNVTPSPPTEIPTPPMTPGPTICVTKPDGSEKTLRVELGKVNSFDSRRALPSRDVAASTSQMARSYSLGSYEYVVDSLRTSFPEQSQTISLSSKPTHRSTLSDSIPIPDHIPGQEDVFWASRGLETPHKLSKVREIMTPSPWWLSSPLQQTELFMNRDLQDHGESEVLNTDSVEHMGEISIENQALEEEVEAPHRRSLSLRLLTSPVAYSLQRTPTDDVGIQESIDAAERLDKFWEVAVDVPAAVDDTDSSSPSKRPSPLNWLKGRISRPGLVYSASSPSLNDLQSTEDKALVT